jgi:hypothetical protein
VRRRVRCGFKAVPGWRPHYEIDILAGEIIRLTEHIDERGRILFLGEDHKLGESQFWSSEATVIDSSDPET